MSLKPHKVSTYREWQHAVTTGQRLPQKKPALKRLEYLTVNAKDIQSTLLRHGIFTYKHRLEKNQK